MTRDGKRYKNKLEKEKERRAFQEERRIEKGKGKGPKSRMRKIIQYLLLSCGLLCFLYVATTYFTAAAGPEKGFFLFPSKKNHKNKR